MKKRLIIIALICAFITAMLLAGCSSGAPDYATSEENYAVTAADCAEKLESFITGREDRTSYSKGEKQAAEYLQHTLLDYGYSDAQLAEFTSTENNRTQTSQNVSAVYAGKDATYSVIIGAFYDNCYGMSPTNSTTTLNADGALSNGSGVAGLLAIAHYLMKEKPELDYNVNIVFFGGSALATTGADEFYKQMDRTVKSNTVLMVELQRLGVDHVYAYSDSRETKREGFFDRVAAQNGYDIYKVSQNSPQITNYSSLNGIPYFQWAQNGLICPFFNGGIPTLNLIGANWDTMSLTDVESASNSNISFTADDTLKNLKRLYPDYSKKIALAASLVIKSLEDGEFLSVMKYDKDNFPDTDVLSKRWVWCVIALGVLVLGMALAMLVQARLAKKYPPAPPAPPKEIKMAVFGMDYEDRDQDSIYIDFKDAPQQESIFPGVPDNNSGFPPVFPVPGASKPKPASPFEEYDEPVKPQSADPFDREQPEAQKTPDSAEKPAAQPVEVKPVEVKPVEVKPVEVKPVEVKPVEVKPVEVKPVEVKPVEVKPRENTKPVEVKPREKTTPVVVKPRENTKPVEVKPRDTKPGESPVEEPAEQAGQGARTTTRRRSTPAGKSTSAPKTTRPNTKRTGGGDKPEEK